MEVKNKQLTFKPSKGTEVKTFIKLNVGGYEIKRRIEKEVKNGCTSNKFN